jgi:iron complex outermembrane receptor protein
MLGALPHVSLSQVANETETEVVKMFPFITNTDRDQGYRTQQTMIGSRTAKNLEDIPSNITIVNRELLDDLGAFTSLASAVQFTASGIAANQTFMDDLTIRGFKSAVVLRDGFASPNYANEPMYNTERVEVIKGPSSMLTGSNTSIAGTVNVVSRTPSAEKKAGIKTTFGNPEYSRLEAYTTGRVYSSKELSVDSLLTVGAKHERPEKKLLRRDDNFVGGGVTMHFGNRTRMTIEGSLYRKYGYNYHSDFMDLESTELAYPGAAGARGALRIAKLSPYDTRSFSFVQPKNTSMDQKAFITNVTYVTSLTDNLSVRAAYHYRDQNQFYHIVRNFGIVQYNYILKRQELFQDDTRRDHIYQIDVTHNLLVKGVRLGSTFGADGTKAYIFRRNQTNNTVPNLDVRSGTYPDDDAFFSSVRVGAGIPLGPNYAQQDARSSSWYIQEDLSLMKNRLILVGGLRWYYPVGTSSTMTAISKLDDRSYRVHKIGAVVKILPSVSIYWTDAENIYPQTGFLDKYVSGDAIGDARKPQLGKLQEVGVKFQHAFSAKLSVYGVTSYYDLKMMNSLTNGLLASPPAAPNTFGNVQNTNDACRGYELDLGVLYAWGPGVANLLVAYAEGKSSTSLDSTLPMENFPRQKYNFIGKYGWTSGALKGLALGVVGSHQSETLFTTYIKYTPFVVNAFARYQAGKHWTYQLNLNNITDKRYIVYGGNQDNGITQASDPFRAMMTVGYSW